MDPSKRLDTRGTGSRLHGLLDRLGASFSTVCALHCLVAPWLLVVYPSMLLALHSHRHPQHHLAHALMWFMQWEWLIALLASLVATTSTLVGYRGHGQLRPVGLALAGSALLILAAATPVMRQSMLWHTLSTVTGGLCLVLAHLSNLKERKRPSPTR